MFIAASCKDGVRFLFVNFRVVGKLAKNRAYPIVAIIAKSLYYHLRSTAGRKQGFCASVLNLPVYVGNKHKQVLC